MSEPATLPGIEQTPTVEPTEGSRTFTLPPWIVLLHNDDVNDMAHVVQALIKSVPKLSTERAVEVMMEAHNQGRAVVVTCPLELAELYRERLEGFGLTATIEKA